MAHIYMKFAQACFLWGVLQTSTSLSVMCGHESVMRRTNLTMLYCVSCRGVPPGARFDPFGPPGVPGFDSNPFIR